MPDSFVFCADLHLADGAWASRPEIFGDSYYSFEQIVDFCLQARLPMVVGGDVLDVKKNWARPISVLCGQMDRMAAAQLPVYFIQGQHELDRVMPWMCVHPWPQHVNKKLFEIDGLKLYGLDWLPRGEIQTAFAEVPPDTDVLVTHQVWQNFMKNIGRPECAISDVHHVRNVLSGDFHITTVETAQNAQGIETQLISTGSTCMQDISECPDKLFYSVACNNQKCIITPQPLKTRNFRNYTIRTQAALDELCAGQLAADIASMTADQPELIQKPLIRVKFDKSLPDAHLRVTTAVADSAHLFCDAIVDKCSDAGPASRANSANDLTTALTELLSADSAALKLAVALLSAEDPAQELLSQYQIAEASDAVTAT